MRSNESVRPLPKSCRLPLGAISIYTVLLCSYINIGLAQTRLDSSQVTPLQGDVRGSFAVTRLRDYNSAADHGDGISNGIASAIADCGVTFSCSILVPPSYGTTETVPGFQLNTKVPSPGATTPGNIMILDRRYGDARMSVNQYGFSAGLIHTPSGWLYNYYSKAGRNAQLTPFAIRELSLDGGASQNAPGLGYTDKTTWATMLINSISHTPGQHVTTTIAGQTSSVGDSASIRNQVTCFGGLTTQGDLGCRAADNIMAEGNVEYSGILAGAPSTGATTVTVSPIQGSGTQGAERFLVRMNAESISAGTIAQVAPSSTSTNVTGSGTSWPVSTVIATLGTNVTVPGSAVVTPSGFTVGSMSGIQNNSLICVADQGAFEMLYPTSVSATSFTANFHTVHPSHALISVGGLCGYLLDLTADDVTDATYPVKLQNITGTLHFAFPVMSSTAATAAQLWVQGDGYFQRPNTRWNASNANGYVLYPYAEVFSTQQSGGLSDTLTLGPNNVRWAAGDTVSEFLYPSYHSNFGNNFVESYYPNLVAGNGWSLTYNMPLQGSEAMISLSNNGPSSIYAAHGGNAYGPFGMHVLGSTSKSVVFDRPPDSAAVAVGCTSPCSSLAKFIAIANSSYYDFVSYDQGAKTWKLSTNTYNAHYSFAAARLNLPFPNTFMANDPKSTGYVATQELRSNSAANSDLNGEVVFSNAIAVTQALTGIYASHPECQIHTQFDTGATNRHWISYASRSFTVNFVTPVTGVVSYSCAARN